MRKFSELREQVSKSDLDGVEKFADRLFAKVGIDVEFTRKKGFATSNQKLSV